MKFSRRHFLETAGIATAVTLAQPGSAFAVQSETGGKLPEPIAKLRSEEHTSELQSP